jgi:hypothetical protein
VVVLQHTPANWSEMWQLNEGKLWWAFSNQDPPEPLPEVLEQIAERGEHYPFVRILNENQGVVRWWIEVNGSDDPPVWCDNDQPDDRAQWSVAAARFSEFVFNWFTNFGFDPEWALIFEDHTPDERVAAHTNGLWLRTPDEPFTPPLIDYLIEQFGEPERTPRPGDVTTYTFRPNGGIIRVTADDVNLIGALSAWWVHVESPDRLAELGRLLLPWGTLRETLRADTDPGREVLRLIRG